MVCSRQAELEYELYTTTRNHIEMIIMLKTYHMVKTTDITNLQIALDNQNNLDKTNVCTEVIEKYVAKILNTK